MGDNLKVLKELGAQKIHQDTHISKEHIQAMIHETFDGLNHVQFIGFISILEREYNIKLDDLKAKGVAYFDELNSNTTIPKKIFIVPKKKKSYASTYLFFGILIFVSFVYYTFVYTDSIAPVIEEVDNTKIENAQKSIRPVLEIQKDIASEDSNETNTTVVNEAEILDEIQEIKENRTLKILPKNKVWVGYIEIETNKKYQKIFRKDFALDTSKNWLLLFGAGNIKLEVNGEIQKYESDKNMRFKYKDGVLTKITVGEFKSLNKGRKW